MPVKDRIREVWEDKVVGCFGSPEQGENPEPPSSGKLHTGPSAPRHSRPSILTCTLSPAIYPCRSRVAFEPRLWYLIIIITLFFNPITAEPAHRKPLAKDWRLTRFLVPQEPSTTAASPTGTYQRSQGSQVPNPGWSVKTSANSDFNSTRDPTDVQEVGGAWTVRDVGTFSNRAVYTFLGDRLPEGLYASDYTVQNRLGDEGPRTGTLYNHKYVPANVQFSNGFARLIVPGGQKPGRRPDKAISCAEIVTTESNISSASVRTRAIFSKVPGTCHGKSSAFVRLEFAPDLCRDVLLQERYARV